MAYETFEDVTADGVRNLRGRYSRPSPLHRRGLQHSQTPLRARLSEPRAIRGSPRPATCQNRRLKLSTIKGALQEGGESFFGLGSRGFRESLDIGHSYVQQGIELGPNLIFLGAGHMAKRAFLLRSHFGSWSFWLMMIEIVVPPSAGIG